MSLKNETNYSLYKCPYEHLEKEDGHELKGPEGYVSVYGIWCSCGFRGPVFYLDPIDLGLMKKSLAQDGLSNNPACACFVDHAEVPMKCCWDIDEPEGCRFAIDGVTRDCCEYWQPERAIKLAKTILGGD